MFTGLIEEIGTVTNIQKQAFSMKIKVQCHHILQKTKIGDSIATNGVCLTVTKLFPTGFEADLMLDTINSTTFKNELLRSNVNLERAVLANTRLGGHIVTGHVDTVGKITRITSIPGSTLIEILLPRDIASEVIVKDSIAIDGVSLTVQEAKYPKIRVSIIPHTLTNTTLHQKKVNDVVNIEFDTLVKRRQQKSKITKSFLEETGFL